MFRKQDFKKIDLLGSGKKNTKIYKAEHIPTGKFYAIKEVEAKTLDKLNEYKEEAVQLYKVQNHPNVLQFFGYYFYETMYNTFRISMVCEYMDHRTNLEYMFRKRKNANLYWKMDEIEKMIVSVISTQYFRFFYEFHEQQTFLKLGHSADAGAIIQNINLIKNQIKQEIQAQSLEYLVYKVQILKLIQFTQQFSKLQQVQTLKHSLMTSCSVINQQVKMEEDAPSSFSQLNNSEFLFREPSHVILQNQFYQQTNHPDNVKQMIDQIHDIASEASSMLEISNNLNLKVQNFHKEIENITQNMLMNLELKLSSKSQEDSGDSVNCKEDPAFPKPNIFNLQGTGFNQEIELFIENQLHNLEFIKENMLKYKSQLQNLNEIEPPQLNLTREVYFKSQAVSQKFATVDQGIFYESMMCQLANNLIALNTKDSTHILEIIDNQSCNDKQFQIIRVFPKLRQILLHQDRLICDGRVYSRKDNFQKEIQIMNLDDITAALAISETILFIGQISMVRFMIWRYNIKLNIYEMIQRKPIFVVPNKRDFYYAHLMKNDFFNPDKPMNLFMAFGPYTLFKIILDGNDIEKSKKDRLYGNKKDRIIDYKGIEQMTPEDTKKQIIIILFSMSAIILDVSNKANVALKQFDTRQDCLVMLNVFQNTSVILNKKSITGTYAICDILDQDISGWLIDSEGLRIIGQIQLYDEGEDRQKIFVLSCDNKQRGSLVIYQLYLC